ncbi:cornichon [Mycena crocata]|nr:cornichon [Mycena crocata]
MSSNTVAMNFTVLLAAGLMLSSVFFIIMFADFELGYIDKVDLCRTLNKFVVAEHFAHTFLAVALLLSGQWLAFIVNTPMVAYNLRQMRSKRDVFDIYDISQNKTWRRLPAWYKYRSLAKLVFYLLSFFFHLYCMTVALIQE